jgi:hypothetical protein
MRYVVAVGNTCDPSNASGVTFKSAFTQFTVFQVRVELPPYRLDVGFALIPAAGVCAAAGTQITAAVPINEQAAMSKSRNGAHSR